MVQYIYIVKCPHCEDEHFDFFDDAKGFALGCLNKNPIITQVEVDRNDFGECTSHADLGTVWSWEDIMAENPEAFETKFSKNDLAYSDEEFDDTIKPFVPTVEPTIDQLVEMMEENEDMVECKCCENLFDKGDCYYDNDYGWLCYGCKTAVESQGDPHHLGEAVATAAKPKLTYKFPNIARYGDADIVREQIYSAIEDAGYPVAMMVKGDHLQADFEELDYSYGGKYPKKTGEVIDFQFTADGILEVILAPRFSRSGTFPMSTAVRWNKNYRTEQLFITICQAAEQINASLKRSRLEIEAEKRAAADEDIYQMLVNSPEVAREYQQHITDVSFSIPLEDDYDFMVDELEPDSLKAAEHLVHVRDSFTALPFADEAIRKGIATNRPVVDVDGNFVEKVFAYFKRWYGSCTIKFDTLFGNLSADAKSIYYASRREGMSNTGKLADVEVSNKVEGYVLAKALIRFFNNDVEFFKHKEPLTDSLHEDTNKGDTVELDYENLTAMVATKYIPATWDSPSDYEEGEFTGPYTYEADLDKVVEVLLNKFLVDEDFADLPGGRADLEDEETFEKFFDEHLEDLVDKYYQQLLDHFEDEASEEASHSEKFQAAYADAMEAAEDDYWDRRYEEERDRRRFGDDY